MRLERERERASDERPRTARSEGPGDRGQTGEQQPDEVAAANVRDEGVASDREAENERPGSGRLGPENESCREDAADRGENDERVQGRESDGRRERTEGANSHAVSGG